MGRRRGVWGCATRALSVAMLMLTLIVMAETMAGGGTPRHTC